MESYFVLLMDIRREMNMRTVRVPYNTAEIVCLSVSSYTVYRSFLLSLNVFGAEE